ncbi:MAG: ribosome biogenesis GTP-binding protein YihA/YsxC [Methylocystaceae bacterium]
MNFRKAAFTCSYVNINDLPTDNYPEVAFAGRSNVGKSSLINCLVGRKGLAKTSSTPGKTRMLNYYTIDEAMYLVDLPGYGFARVSQAEKRKWGCLIEDYLTKRDQLKGVIQLVDIRHPPTVDDVMMWQFLAQIQVPAVVVANKADKISRGQWLKQDKIIRETLGLGQGKIIIFSAETRQGMEEVQRTIISWVET